jgi:uncharacterized protein (TIGR03435 family)
MILGYLSAGWTAVASALGNHLWQSTVFAILVGFLILFLRNNHARVRYALWLAASVKFLLPFSLLVGIGGHLGWLRGSGGPQMGFSVAIEQLGEPFTRPAVSVISRAAPSTISASFTRMLPALFVAVWVCGFLLVLFLWGVRWRGMSAALRGAVPLCEGREVETLRRLERMQGMPRGIEVRLSRASLEPGIFGVRRPVLVWPEGISEHLADEHLEAVLVHELWHVRRADNLAAVTHMVVEATFWFHPLVWWLGSRLVEERERACDEAVVESGSDRHVYAESILNICEFCVGPQLSCVSGVTGANLKKRIGYIMSERVARKLDFSRKLLLGAAGLAAIGVPVVFGLLHATQGRAESQASNAGGVAFEYSKVSIQPTTAKADESGKAMTTMLGRPDGMTARNVTLQQVIRAAYGVEDNQVSGAPSWLSSDKYDIEATIETSVVEELNKLGPDQRSLERRRMLQTILAERLKLVLRRETKELPVEALVVADNGPKLRETNPGGTYSNGFKLPDGRPAGAGTVFVDPGQGKLTAQGLPMAELVKLLSQHAGRTVLDETGLTGKYDYMVHWTPSDSQDSMLAAIQEQLGLELKSQTAPMEVLVIDHVEKPE